ncbi:MAG: glycosyltransferase family 4 protein [Deltaproteobacteria bacterium]|nr:glycosyltransferase family 4 protein [Deltaproteobacteria bacterium]
MKRILMLFSMSFEPYQGRYLRAFNEARTLQENGYQVTVLGWDRSGKSEPFEVRDGIRIERIFEAAPDTTSIKSSPNFFKFAFKVLFHLRKKRFDFIHCHNLQLLPLGILLKTLKKASLIFDSCEPDYYAIYPNKLKSIVKVVEKFMANRADAILVHNDYQFKKYRNGTHPSVTLIGSYPAKELMLETVKKSQNGEKVVIGRIGSIYHDNGIEEILAGFRSVSDQLNNVELLFAGRVFEGYKEQFKRLIKGMEKKVTVLGAFDFRDMPKLYSMIDISIIVYRRSLWFRNITPTKFFDSLSMGVPVIASDMGGLKDIVERYGCGVIVDERNPEEVAEAIKKMIENPNQRYEMAFNGLKAIKESYNWERMQERLLKVYSALQS